MNESFYRSSFFFSLPFRIISFNQDLAFGAYSPTSPDFVEPGFYFGLAESLLHDKLLNPVNSGVAVAGVLLPEALSAGLALEDL